MNEYVQKYLENKKILEKEILNKQIQKVVNKLRIGEREFPDSPNFSDREYPYWDENKGYYRYNAGEISEEEYNLLKQSLTDDSTPIEQPERSGWYTFSVIIMVFSSLGLFVCAILSISEENAMYFLIGLGEFLMISLFCGILQLLAGIKLGIDKLQKQ